MLVAIEGVDAVGKATQTAMLKTAIERAGYQVAMYAFPNYASPTGSIVKKLLRGALHDNGTITTLEDMRITQGMMWLDKLEAKLEMSLHLGARNKIVICDRYSASALAYGIAEGLDKDWLLAINDSLLVPDVQILLDADPELVAKRRTEARDRNEGNFTKLKRVRDVYVDMWTKPASYFPINVSRGPAQFRILDASESPEQIHRKILNTVCKQDYDKDRAQWIRDANE